MRHTARLMARILASTSDGKSFGDVAAGDRKGEQRIERPSGDDDAERAAGEKQHGGLDQQLTHEPSATGAKGGAHEAFARARHGAGEDQVRDVGARDQQDERDGAQHQQQTLLGPSLQRRVVLPERHRPKAAAGVGRRVVERQATRHGIERRLRAGDRDAGLQARDDIEILVRARLGILGGDERPDHVGAEAEHVRRQHADDRDRLIVDDDGAADRRRIRTESAHPPGMREQGDACASGVEVLREEAAAEERLHAERVEPRRGDHRAADRFTRTIADPHDEAPAIVGRDALEHVLLRREVDEIGPRDVIRGLPGWVPQILTSRDGSSYGSDRKTTVSTSVKMAALAPTPIATVAMARAAKPLFLSRPRTA